LEKGRAGRLDTALVIEFVFAEFVPGHCLLLMIPKELLETKSGNSAIICTVYQYSCQS